MLVLPNRQQGTVKSLEVDGAAATFARAGDSVDMTLADVDPAGLGAGSVICHPDWPVPLASRFTARLLVLEVSVPILQGQQVCWSHAFVSRPMSSDAHGNYDITVLCARYIKDPGPAELCLRKQRRQNGKWVSKHITGHLQKTCGRVQRRIRQSSHWFCRLQSTHIQRVKQAA